MYKLYLTKYQLGKKYHQPFIEVRYGYVQCIVFHRGMVAKTFHDYQEKTVSLNIYEK